MPQMHDDNEPATVPPMYDDNEPATVPPAADEQMHTSALASQAEAGNAYADVDEDAEPRAQLLESDERQAVITRWKEIQAQFVDEPRRAVRDADALVGDLMQRLARLFAGEHDQLESRWASGADVSTEDLRQGLRRYRSFFERLLAA